MVFGISHIIQHLALAGVHTAAHTLAQASQSDSDERNTYAARRERTAARGREQARHYVIVANGNEHRTVEGQSSRYKLCIQILRLLKGQALGCCMYHV